MEVHAIKLLRSADLADCLERGQRAAKQWQQAWLAATPLILSCAEAGDPVTRYASGEWCHGSTGNGRLWCHLSAGFVKRIERAIFALDADSGSVGQRSSELAMGTARGALDDLLGALLAAYGAHAEARPEQSPPEWMLRRYSGNALLVVGLGSEILSLLVPVDILSARGLTQSGTERVPLVPLSVALSATTVRLHAELGEAEMTIGHFASLAVGDVLHLPIGIDSELKVVGEDGRPWCSAHLGRQDGYRAVEVFKADQ